MYLKEKTLLFDIANMWPGMEYNCGCMQRLTIRAIEQVVFK